MNIGRKVREVREDIGMPRAELARRIGMSETNMLRIESGQRQPSIRSLELIASALRTEPSQLLEPAGKEPALPKHSAPTPEAGPTQIEMGRPGDEAEYGPQPTLEHDYKGPLGRRYDAEELAKREREIVAAFEAEERGDISAKAALRRVKEELQPILRRELR